VEIVKLTLFSGGNHEHWDCRDWISHRGSGIGYRGGGRGSKDIRSMVRGLELSLLCTLSTLSRFIVFPYYTSIGTTRLLVKEGKGFRFDRNKRTFSNSRTLTMNSSLFHAVEELHSIQSSYSLFLSGGAVSISQWLLSVSGGSRSIKDIQIPYSRSAFQAAISNKSNITSFCSEDAAVSLAKAAYEKTIQCLLAEQLDDLYNLDISRIFGVGCTASLVSSEPKRGPHHCHFAIYSSTGIETFHINLEKGARIRPEEDAVCSLVLLDIIRRHCALSSLSAELYQPLSFPVPEFSTIQLTPSSVRAIGDSILQRLRKTQHGLEEVLSGSKNHVLLFPSECSANTDNDNCINIDNSWLSCEDIQLPEDTIVFPGSFNPLHPGHVQLVEAALHRLRLSSSTSSISSTVSTDVDKPRLVVFELSAVNADKAPLSLSITQSRLLQFAPSNPLLRESMARHNYRYAVAVSRLPLFTMKAKVFEGVTFLLGADTFVRLLQPKYYIPSSSADSSQDKEKERELGLLKLSQALAEVQSHGCNFTFFSNVVPGFI
jgi:hypothetical protein